MRTIVICVSSFISFVTLIFWFWISTSNFHCPTCPYSKFRITFSIIHFTCAVLLCLLYWLFFVSSKFKREAENTRKMSVNLFFFTRKNMYTGCVFLLSTQYSIFNDSKFQKAWALWFSSLITDYKFHAQVITTTTATKTKTKAMLLKLDVLSIEYRQPSFILSAQACLKMLSCCITDNTRKIKWQGYSDVYSTRIFMFFCKVYEERENYSSPIFKTQTVHLFTFTFPGSTATVYSFLFSLSNFLPVFNFKCLVQPRHSTALRLVTFDTI